MPADDSHTLVSLLDISAPAKTALDLFLLRMAKGAVVVFDELNAKPFPDATTAALGALDLDKRRLRRFHFEPRMSYAVVGDRAHPSADENEAG